MFVTSYSVTIVSYSAYTFRENREFDFVIIVHFMMGANSRIHFALQIVLVCLYSTPFHYHHCVSKIKHIFSVIHYKIHYTICGAVCFLFTLFPCADWENIYTLSYYHHQIGSMNYYPLLRVRSWNNGVRCMSFYMFIANFYLHASMTCHNRAFVSKYHY